MQFFKLRSHNMNLTEQLYIPRPVSRRISRWLPAEKNFGLAAVDFAKPPAAGRKKFG